MESKSERPKDILTSIKSLKNKSNNIFRQIKPEPDKQLVLPIFANRF